MRFNFSFVTILAVIFSFSILFVPASYAAKSINLREQSLDAPSGPQSLYVLPSAANAQDSPEIQEMSKEIDAQGNTHIHSRQTYLGYPVWGAEKLTHISSKGERTENGIVFQGVGADLQNTPSYVFSKAQSDLAIQKALGDMQTSAKMQKVSRQDSQLMVYVDDTHKAHWVFQVELYVKSGNTAPTNPFYLMDAKTFEVYKKWDGIQFFDAVKAGGFGGNQKTGMSTYDGLPGNKPVLDMMRDSTTGICYLQNNKVIVTDGRLVNYDVDVDGKNAPAMSFKCDQVDSAHGSIYWDGALDEVNGAWSPGNDALYLAEKVNSMYLDWYHIPVVYDVQNNKNPMKLIMLVHDQTLLFDLGGLFWGGMNAAWDPVLQGMRFGDGVDLLNTPSDSDYPYVTPDVVAHELSHGFSRQHAKFFSFGMPGGLDESFSDMASKAFEYYLTGRVTWTEGADSQKNNVPIRYLDEPTKDCQANGKKCSISNAKDFTPGINVHNSAGVFNKAFYLLSTSSGWNPHKAFDIMVQANRYHWTSGFLDFQEAACGVWDAAKDLSYSKADLAVVTNAMSQVGLEASQMKCHPWSPSAIWSWATERSG